ncbi:MAG TPA: BglII/BstYI family type II restriction endonuclease [Allosphingosinicella sp.]|nr:BglII/BstYI family type II restriction endonuclease [Allosphingosinicella sp.]
MTDDVTEGAKSIQFISARDADLGDVLPPEFLDRYEVRSYRNATRILASASPGEFAELIQTLMSFSISTMDMVKGGGNKSQIALKMDDLLYPHGWYETRIRGDMLIQTMTVEPNPAFGTKRKEKKTTPVERAFTIQNIIDGHKIDFIKNRVAFDMEWNSKDQTFDRDLYAMRTFYEAGIIDAGVLLTRDVSLGPLFAEIGKRVHIKDFKSKYGASTTWMGKLTYRLDAGRGGGCPILAIGIKPPVVSDYEQWKGENPIIKKGLAADDLVQGGEDEDPTEE